MSKPLRIAYFAHSLRSDWNNGNAHFLRGLLRSMVRLGHQVRIFEPREGWSITKLREEASGACSLARFSSVYPELQIEEYASAHIQEGEYWMEVLQDCDVVMVHEWNPPVLAQCLLALRPRLGYKLLFHDTHHRASSAADQIASFGIPSFDGVLAFGDALRTIYQQQFGIGAVWTLHEAADTSIFRPALGPRKTTDVLWIGNWGDGERSNEICEFLLAPAASMPQYRFAVHGVRYPQEGRQALEKAGVRYCGYLSNLDAPRAYDQACLTVHIPRQQYVTAMAGIPTIRVFEALACGIPLISAPWQDVEQLFNPGDYRVVSNRAEMAEAMRSLLQDRAAAEAQAHQGRETVLGRHTCDHRAQQLTSICEEILN